MKGVCPSWLLSLPFGVPTDSERNIIQNEDTFQGLEVLTSFRDQGLQRAGEGGQGCLGEASVGEGQQPASPQL